MSKENSRMEPTCPRCYAGNAMLHHLRPNATRFHDDRKCRDCGFVELESHANQREVCMKCHNHVSWCICVAD